LGEHGEVSRWNEFLGYEWQSSPELQNFGIILFQKPSTLHLVALGVRYDGASKVLARKPRKENASSSIATMPSASAFVLICFIHSKEAAELGAFEV
jgi:hypothetical protein